MSELIVALDEHNNKQLGENLHYEYKWNNNIQEKLVQLYFQLCASSTKVFPERTKCVGQQGGSSSGC